VDQKIEILLVEDSPSDAMLTRRFLEAGLGERVTIHLAQQLCDAIDLIRDSRIPIILLDLGLPDCQGMETLLRMRLAAPESAIVVLTREGDSELAEQSIAVGAQDYIVKVQLDSDLLCRSVKFSLERQRQTNELRKAYAVAEKNVDGLIVVDRDGMPLYANAAAQRMFGKSFEELKKAPIGFSPVSGKTTDIEILRDGKRPLMAEICTADFDWSGTPAQLVSLRDTTDRKKP
jgi:DNA-binding response OmpR family regulator